MTKRIIKFRAWDNRKCRWVDPVNFAFPTSGNLMIRGMGTDWYELSEFTGFLDREGREIFEGDIVENQAKQINQVIMENGCWVLDTEDRPYTLYHQSEFLKVIANVYQNPELMIM